MDAINTGNPVTVTTDPGFSLNNSPEDPTQVKLIWYRRGEPPTTWTFGSGSEVRQLETGKFEADIPTDKPGTYYFRWVGSGGVDAAKEDSFEVVSDFGG